MRHDVVLEGLSLAKGFFTIGAMVGLDAAMDDLDVSRHVADTRKDRRAQFAGVLLLASVIVHVDLQLMHCRLAQATRRTHVVLDPLMSHKMLLEFVLGGIFLGANRAFEGHQSCVRVRMLLQSRR